MRKPNSIIVLLHIFSGLFTLKCVNFGSFREQWWKRWSNVFCVHQNFDRITVTISKSLLMAEDTPYPSENLVSPVTCWTDLKRRRQKSFKNEKRKTKKKQRKKTLQLHWRLRSLQKSREVIWATLRFLFLFFFVSFFVFFVFLNGEVHSQILSIIKDTFWTVTLLYGISRRSIQLILMYSISVAKLDRVWWRLRRIKICPTGM